MHSFERALRQLVPATVAGLLFVTSATAGPIDASVYRKHVATLASDEFEGRKPGTLGETRTLEYLEGEFRKLGLGDLRTKQLVDTRGIWSTRTI